MNRFSASTMHLPASTGFWLITVLCLTLLHFSLAQKSTFMPLEERVKNLVDISLKKPVVRLNPEKFRNYIGYKGVGQPVRNYSFVVMLTALSPMRQCSVCRSAADEFNIVASSWRYSAHFQPNLFFGLVDYDEGSDIFQQLKINSAPVFLYFGERQVKINTLTMKHADQMDIQRIGFAAETIGRWIFEKSNVAIRVIRPPNYTASFIIIICLGVFSVFIYVRRNNLDFLYNRTWWAIIALAIVFAMTSGQMWSHIRSPPLLHRSANGISYIHAGSGGQYIIETYIVYVINCAISVGFILIIQSMKSNVKIDAKKRRMMIIGGMVLVAFFFSLLLSIFRGKAHGYPYSFLLK